MTGRSRAQMDAIKSMEGKQLKFGGQFANKKTQENTKMEVLRKTVVTTILVRGLHKKHMNPKLQSTIVGMFSGHARRASNAATGSGAGSSLNSRFVQDDEVTIENIRKEAGSTNESPGCEFDVKIATSKLGFERLLVKKMEALQDSSEKFLAALQAELRAANVLEYTVINGLRTRFKKIVVYDPTAIRDREKHVRPQKFFPYDSLDYFMNVKRLVKQEAEEVKAREDYARGKRLAKVDRHERWECARCKHSNKIGTSVCAICKAGSEAYQRNRLDPSKADHLPFHAENCKSLKVEQIFQMAKDGVDFEERDGMGYTGLHCACHYGSLPLADAMLRCGAELEAETNDGWRPLHFAAHSGVCELVSRLLRDHPDVNAQTTRDGYAPIHMAARYGHYQAMELLLEAGAEIDLQTTLQARTALHYAAYEGHPEVIETLLNWNCDMELTDDDGWKALAHAQFRCNTECEAILVGKHADGGDWKDDTFQMCLESAGWQSRIDPDFVIRPGSEAPLELTRFHVPNKVGWTDD